MGTIVSFKRPTPTKEEVDRSLAIANEEYNISVRGSKKSSAIAKEMVDLAEVERKLAEAKKNEAESKSAWVSAGMMAIVGIFNVWWEGHGRILPRKVEEIERSLRSKIFRK